MLSPAPGRIARDNQVPVPVKQRARASRRQRGRRAKGSACARASARTRRDRSVADDAERPARTHAEPQRGSRADYMRLVQKNAEQNLKAFLVHQEVQETAQALSLTELADALELPEPPHRIECYDISNIQGTNPVSSMVVFVEGRAKKSEYRKFKIQYDKGPNDFAMMQETLRRRLRYLRARNGFRNKRPRTRACEKRKVQQEAGPVADRRRQRAVERRGRGSRRAGHDGYSGCGFGERTRVAVSARTGRIRSCCRPTPRACIWSCAFATKRTVLPITYHRQRRAKAMTQSALDALAGVGPVRKKRLLAAFGSVAAIKRATIDEIAAIKGMTPALAAQVKSALEGGS